MNRIIKFRCWSDGEMTTSENMPDMGFWKFVAYDSRSIVMQFTGLVDKNGKEIYEGDIVAEIDKFDELMVVEFGDYSDGPDSWGLMFSTRGFFLRYQDRSESSNRFEFWHVTGIHNCKSSYGFSGGRLMIVGNIYEHSHLLKQEKV